MNKGTKNNSRKQKKYIPENLDLEMILKENPPDFDYKIDHFIHIINLLTELPAYDKTLLDGQGFVPLNAKRLQGHIHNYKDYIRYLMDTGVLESDRQFFVGEKSIGYRFTEKYRIINKEVQVDKSMYNHKYKKSTRVDSKCLYPILAKYFNEDLIIDVQAAEEFIKKKYRMDTIAGNKNTYLKYNAAMLNIRNIEDHQYYFKVDETSGRLHTNLTNLPKMIRNFITYQGIPLVSVDISNSQPLLSTLLLDRKFFEKNRLASQNLFNIYNIFPQLPSSHPTLYNSLPTIMLVFGEDFLRKQGNQDITKYCQKASEGKLYEYMEEEIFKANGKRFKDRREIKDMIFSVLYSGNRFIGQPKAESKRLFRNLFPTVYEVFRLIKRNDKTLLPVLLQSIEAKLVLNNISKRFCKEQPGVPIFTIHDSIVCPIGYEFFVKKIMEEETLRHVGILPLLKFEFWNPDNIVNEVLYNTTTNYINLTTLVMDQSNFKICHI